MAAHLAQPDLDVHLGDGSGFEIDDLTHPDTIHTFAEPMQHQFEKFSWLRNRRATPYIRRDPPIHTREPHDDQHHHPQRQGPSDLRAETTRAGARRRRAARPPRRRTRWRARDRQRHRVPAALDRDLRVGSRCPADPHQHPRQPTEGEERGPQRTRRAVRPRPRSLVVRGRRGRTPSCHRSPPTPATPPAASCSGSSPSPTPPPRPPSSPSRSPRSGWSSASTSPASTATSSNPPEGSAAGGSYDSGTSFDDFAAAGSRSGPSGRTATPRPGLRHAGVDRRRPVQPHPPSPASPATSASRR